MRNLKNKLVLVSSLAAVLSMSCVAAEAGVSRSGGRSLSGHSAMSNRAAAGHNMGSRSGSGSNYSRSKTSSSGKFTVSQNVSHSSGLASHSTTVVNNTNGNSIQHAGNSKQAETSTDLNKHESARTVNLNGQTYGVNKITSVGSLGEGTEQSKIDHEVTSKHGSVFRDRRTLIMTSDATGSVTDITRSTSSLIQNNEGETVKSYGKNTIITPGSKTPVHHHGNILSTPESDLS